MSIIFGILIFGLIVLIHELGHFLSARICKIGVEEFSIGMGPKLLSYKLKTTLYSIRLFPIGGFCSLVGEEKESNSSNSFNNKSVSNRIFVVCAGVFMNLLLSLIIFFTLNLINGSAFCKVNKVLNNSPAYESGIIAGDIIKKINGHKINISQDINFYINESMGKKIVINIERNKKNLNFNLKPVKYDNDYYIGIERFYKSGFFDNVSKVKKINLIESFCIAYYNLIFYIKISLIGLSRLILGKINFKEIAGPIGIIHVIGKSYNESMKESVFYMIQTLLNFMAIISANVGIFNLLPLPALDGGKLFFLLLESIRKKKVNQKYETLIHLIGFGVLIIFAIIVAVNDITRLIGYLNFLN